MVGTSDILWMFWCIFCINSFPLFWQPVVGDWYYTEVFKWTPFEYQPSYQSKTKNVTESESKSQGKSHTKSGLNDSLVTEWTPNTWRITSM